MSDPTTAPPAGRFRRLRPLAAPFLRVWRWFYYAPRTVQVGLVLVLTVGLGVGAYFGNSYLKRRTAEREVSGGWRQFEDAARKVDVEGMNAGLDRVLAARPGDPVAERRKAGLAALSADENDPELAVVLVNYHVAHDRLPAAAREARKVLTKFPKDWRAICVLAHNALQTERDLGACKKWLDELPAPDDPGARLDVGGLLYAIRLSDVVGRDATPLRGLIVRRLLPLLRGQSAGEAPPQVKAQLIESYLQPFADPAEAGELAGYWGDVSRLHERAVAEAAESGDVTTLLRVGGLAPRLEAALAVIRDYQVKSVPADPPEEHDAKVKELDDRFAVLVREVNDRTRRAWQAVRERDPTRPEPYLGLYRIARREKDAAGMVRALQDGLVACGGRVELLEPFVQLLSEAGDPGLALKLAWLEAEAAKTDPVKWCLAAYAGLAAGRRDAALQACEQARQIAPDHRWACATEARLLLENGQASAARELLLRLGEPVLNADPSLARLSARAMVEDGLFALADGAADEVVKATVGKQPSPVVPVGFLRGVLDARGIDPDRAAWVAARAQKLLSDWPDDPSARRLIADALYRRSELSDPPWAPDPGRAAVRGYQALPAADHADPAVAAPLAALSLRVLKDPAAALRAAAPLRDPNHAPLLNPAQLEILGAVLTANGHAGEAVEVLERAVRTPRAPAGCWTQLALAYHAERRTAEARQAIERALNQPRSDREQAEWAAAKLLIYRE